MKTVTFTVGNTNQVVDDSHLSSCTYPSTPSWCVVQLVGKTQKIVRSSSHLMDASADSDCIHQPMLTVRFPTRLLTVRLTTRLLCHQQLRRAMVANRKTKESTGQFQQLFQSVHDRLYDQDFHMPSLSTVTLSYTGYLTTRGMVAPLARPVMESWL